MFWLFCTWCDPISVSLLNPVGFLHSYWDLGMLFQWAVWMQCYCILLGSSVVVSASFCILCGHISSLWGLHPAGASASRTNTHTPVLSVVVSWNVTNRRRTQTIKQLLMQKGRLRSSCSELKFPLNIFPSSSSLLCIPLHLSPLSHFLSISSIQIQSKGYS